MFGARGERGFTRIIFRDAREGNNPEYVPCQCSSAFFPPPNSNAGSPRRSRMHVAFGVLRSSDGVVRSGRISERPSQNCFVEIAFPCACVRSQSSAGPANLERLGILFSFSRNVKLSQLLASTDKTLLNMCDGAGHRTPRL